MSRALAYFSNGIGNFALMMPAFQAVASMTDEKKIDICLSDDWKDPRRRAVEEICDKWEMVSKLFSWPTRGFNQSEYGLWFYSAHGSKSDVSHIFLRQMNYRPIPKPGWRSSLIHELDHYMEIAYAMGYEGIIPKVNFPLADQPILDLKRPIIGICNGAFNTKEWKKKRWEHFPRLAETMRNFFGASVVGVGVGGELSGVEMNIDFTDKLTITETAKVISQCDLFITTDTGNMHIADLMEVPLIAIFASTLTSKNAARNKRAFNLISGLDCAPCQDTTRFFSCQEKDCMGSITVGDVMAVAKQKYLLNGNNGGRK